MEKHGLIAFNHGIQTVLGEAHRAFDQNGYNLYQNQWESPD